MERSSSPSLLLSNEEGEPKRNRTSGGASGSEIKQIGTARSGPRGCVLYDGFLVRNNPFLVGQFASLTDGRLVRLLSAYKRQSDSQLGHFVVQILFSFQQMKESYSAPDKKSFNEGACEWLPHHTQLPNELLLSTVLGSITADLVEATKALQRVIGTEHTPPPDVLFYKRFFHPPARAVWAGEMEPAVNALAYLTERYAGHTSEDPIVLDDDTHAQDMWIENESGPTSFMERAHHNLRWSRWLSRKASADQDENLAKLGELEVDIRGEMLREDRPPYESSARRQFYGACKVRGTVYNVGDFALLNLEDNYTPPYVARIERIYKVIHMGKREDSASNDWEVDVYWMWTLSQTFLSGIPADKIACRELAFSCNLTEERVPQGALMGKAVVQHLSAIPDIRAFVRHSSNWWHRGLAYDPAMPAMQLRSWIHKAPVNLLTARSRVQLDAYHEQRLTLLSKDVRMVGNVLRTEELGNYRKTFYKSSKIANKSFTVGDAVLMLVDTVAQVTKRTVENVSEEELERKRNKRGDDEPFWVCKILELYEGRWLDEAHELHIESLVNVEYFYRLRDITTKPPLSSPDWSREVCASSERGIHPLGELVSLATVRPLDSIPQRHWASYMREPTHFFCRYHYDKGTTLFTRYDGSLPRSNMVPQMQPKRALRVLDLYAGAGGFSVGLENVGLDVAQPIQEFLKTIRSPHAPNFYPQRGQVDVVIGGPPCQTFSTQNMSASTHTPAVNLVGHFYDVVAELEPTYVVMENVPGIVRDDMVIIAEALRRLHTLGYQWRVGLLNAGLFGAAQLRSRVLIVGARFTAPLPVWPTPTHTIKSLTYFSGVPRDKLTSLRDGLVLRTVGAPLPCTTLRDVITDLDEGDQDVSDEYRTSVHTTTGVAARLRGSCSKARQQTTMAPANDSICRRFEQGKTKKRLAYDEPSPTVTSRQENMVHPEQQRVVTIRELARIQGFPDRVIFYGMPVNMVKQIGNAVPTALGEAVGRALNESAMCVDTDDCKPPPECWVSIIDPISEYVRNPATTLYVTPIVASIPPSIPVAAVQVPISVSVSVGVAKESNIVCTTPTPKRPRPTIPDAPPSVPAPAAVLIETIVIDSD